MLTAGTEMRYLVGLAGLADLAWYPLLECVFMLRSHSHSELIQYCSSMVYPSLH